MRPAVRDRNRRYRDSAAGVLTARRECGRLVAAAVHCPLFRALRAHVRSPAFRPDRSSRAVRLHRAAQLRPAGLALTRRALRQPFAAIGRPFGWQLRRAGRPSGPGQSAVASGGSQRAGRLLRAACVCFAQLVRSRRRGADLELSRRPRLRHADDRGRSGSGPANSEGLRRAPTSGPGHSPGRWTTARPTSTGWPGQSWHSGSTSGGPKASGSSIRTNPESGGKKSPRRWPDCRAKTRRPSPP